VQPIRSQPFPAEVIALLLKTMLALHHQIYVTEYEYVVTSAVLNLNQEVPVSYQSCPSYGSAVFQDLRRGRGR
jgi:hypothetical protein